MTRRFLISLMTLCCLTAMAQRRITPVDNPSTATQHVNETYNPDSVRRANLVEMKDASGRTILIDTISGTEVVDSAALKVVPKMEYPLLYAVNVGVDIWDPVMRLFGQKYGGIGFSGELNMHNRYIGVVEIGFGAAKNTPDDNNFTYKGSFAPYFKIGANYNFLYNSSPDYMVMGGLRYGLSPFSFALTDISVDSPYWQETGLMSIPSQRVTVGYFELLFNLRVRIVKEWSVGWSFKYHQILHQTKTRYGEPWYIPGYGTSTSSITGAFTVSYTFDLSKKKGRHALPGATYPAGLPPIDSRDASPERTPHFHPTSADDIQADDTEETGETEDAETPQEPEETSTNQ